MILIETPLQGLVVVRTAPMADERGRFVRVFCEEVLASLRPGLHFTQINLSRTATRGTVRGMHYQLPPAAEAKLIRCVRGRVLDVAVDLRERSSTFGKWHAVELDHAGADQIFIPEGFAHGFQALEDDVELLYMHTRSWNREHERTVRHDDPAFAIEWPLPVTKISDRDRNAAFMPTDFRGIQS